MKIESVKEFLRNRKMLFFLFGTFFFMINISISYSVVPLYLDSQNFTLAQIGISTTIYSLSAILLRVFLGPLADRKGRRFALLISSFSFILSWLFIWLAPSYEAHLFARVFQALGLAMYMSSASCVVSDVVDSRILGSSMGIYRGFVSIGIILGPVYALILSGIGFNVMFMGIMITSLISFILLTFISETKADFGNTCTKRKSSMIKDYLILLRNPRLVRYYLAIMIATSGYGIINTNSAVFLDGLDGVLRPSTFLFLYGCVGMYASLAGGRQTDRRGIKKVIIPSAFLALAGFVGMAFVESYGNIALISVIVTMALGTNSLVISAITGIGRETTSDLKASSYSIMESAYDGGFAVGNLLFGLVVTAVGYTQSFLIVGLLLTLSYIGLFIGDYLNRRN